MLLDISEFQDLIQHILLIIQEQEIENVRKDTSVLKEQLLKANVQMDNSKTLMLRVGAKSVLLDTFEQDLG